MGNVINLKKFQNKKLSKSTNIPTSTHDISLNDIKIQLIQYFSEFEIPHLFIKPVNLECPYEKILLKIAALFFEGTSQDISMKVAEELYKSDISGLSLNGFIECINKDDLLMGCFQEEIRSLKEIDQLFLVNILNSKFPQEQTAINLMKTFLFAQDQSHKLENKTGTQEG